MASIARAGGAAPVERKIVAFRYGDMYDVTVRALLRVTPKDT